MPTDPVLKKKWERVFYTFFDINRNKVIDWPDFELLFDKIKAVRGEDSTEYKIASDAMLMVWKGLLSETKGIDITDDADEGVEVSINEWDVMWSRFNPKAMPIWQWEYVKYMFFLLDSSGDKYIDADEYSDVMQIYGVSKEDARKCFEKFAVDGRGKPVRKVDYGMFVRLWYDYFGSTDPNKPGNHLFGP